MAFCGKCGNMVPKGSKFCMNCGAPTPAQNVSQTPIQPVPQASVQPAPQPVPQTPYGQPVQKPKSKLPVIIGTVAAVIVAGLIGFGAYMFIGGMTGAGEPTGTALTQMLDQAGFNRQFGDGGKIDE